MKRLDFSQVHIEQLFGSSTVRELDNGVEEGELVFKMMSLMFLEPAIQHLGI